ncbi:MAG: hypothetical protein IH950_08405 [Bacteroidetes bacterium]|nr:hypothetical protein [Bacteroidota bacterium]MCH8033760.1 hypothetical protein [Bacteroidota bacterium]
MKCFIPSNVKRETSNEDLKVYDVLDNEIVTLVNKEKLAGAYEVEFDATELTSGINFCQLIAKKFRVQRKMVLLR